MVKEEERKGRSAVSGQPSALVDRIQKTIIVSISPSTLMEEARMGETVIVDAMPANFYQKRHIRGAVNMPLPLFDIVYMMTFSEEDKEKPIVVYGQTISRLYDLEVAGKLILRGHTRIKVLDGGLSAWEEQGYPVEGKAEQ